MNESAADWGLVFDTLLLMAFLQSDAETPEAAAEKFVRKLLDIPADVDLRTETPEERRARSDKWYAQEWEKIMQEMEEMKMSESTVSICDGCVNRCLCKFCDEAEGRAEQIKEPTKGAWAECLKVKLECTYKRTGPEERKMGDTCRSCDGRTR